MIINTYGGFIKDQEKLLQSASGGLAAAMAEKVILEQGAVWGAAYTKDFKNVEYIRATSLSQAERLKGSKYIKARLTKATLEAIVCDLSEYNTVLFTGVPCDVAALKQYLKKHNVNDDNLICVDLICHGPTSPKVAEQYIEDLEKTFKAKIINFSVRYKNPLWTPPHLYAEFENGKKYIKPFYGTSYATAFMMMSESGCFNCKNKGDNYKSDITIGDYWGCDKNDKAYNKFGTSVAFVHTNIGDAFIKTLDNFNLFPADEKKALAANERYFIPTEKSPKKEQFRKNFEKKGLKYAVKKSRDLKTRIKIKVKKVMSVFDKG